MNIVDNDGDTPLHHCDTAASVQYLLSKGADINAVNHVGIVPPCQAFIDRNEELIDFYTGVGVDYSEMQAALLEQEEGMIEQEGTDNIDNSNTGGCID